LTRPTSSFDNLPDRFTVTFQIEGRTATFELRASSVYNPSGFASSGSNVRIVSRPQFVQYSGFFGKLPRLSDFLSRRIPRTFPGPWDNWLQQA
jgi:hypothetical protein